MLTPLEPQLRPGGRRKGVAPVRRDIADPAEASERSPPIGHVAAAGAGKDQARGQIGEGELRGQEGDHKPLADLVVDRQHHNGVQRSQPQHGDDHTKPGKTVRHPHQHLGPGEKGRGQQSRPDQGRVDLKGPPREERDCPPKDRHDRGATDHRPARQCPGGKRQREHPRGIDRWAPSQVAGHAEAEHGEEVHERHGEGHDRHGRSSIRRVELDGLARPEDQELDRSQDQQITENSDQRPEMTLPKFPGDRGRGGTHGLRLRA